MLTVLTVPETVGVAVAVVATIALGFFLRRFIGGVEETMNEMRDDQRAASCPKSVEPPRVVGARRRRR